MTRSGRRRPITGAALVEQRRQLIADAHAAAEPAAQTWLDLVDLDAPVLPATVAQAIRVALDLPRSYVGDYWAGRRRR